MGDPRRHPASSFTTVAARRTSSSQHPDEAADLTWLDFLRTAGGTVLDRPDCVDRKRRRAGTGTSPERRPYPNLAHTMESSGTRYRRPSDTGNVQESGGNNVQNAIDLATPPRARPTTLRDDESRRSSAGSGARRRGSDVVLPSWQPDSEVSQCPVCHTDFGFWYRKHHCRKCGRVVCAACSPHRITIPRQYIVQPPNPFEPEYMTSELHGSRSPDAALGGGEVVRVCNPCVPDPWTPDTTSPTRASEPTDIPPRPLIERARNVRSGEVRTMGNQQSGQRPGPPKSPPTGFRTRAQSHTPTTNHSQVRAPVYSIGPGGPTRNAAFDSTRLPPQPPPPSSRPVGHRYSHSTVAQPNVLPELNIRRRSALGPPPARTAPPPKRQVREEDECPVCGEELSPGDKLREAHIESCIAARFSSSTPSQPPMAPPPRPARAESTPTGASSSTPPAFSQPPAPRPRGGSYRPRGMALYRATEKDCSTEDGEPQECVICFEEFQPGDEMGRMECLCKFHRVCLRQWWDTKGDGSCPTHQLQE